MTELGPILSFRGADAERWRLSVLIVSEIAPGKLSWVTGSESDEVSPEEIYAIVDRKVWRFTFDLPLQEVEVSASYSVLGETFEVALPASGASPRCFYASCNGFSSMKLMKGVQEKNALWTEMRMRHDAAPNHLLLMGGDQVYADSMWEVTETLRVWNERSFDEGNEAPVTPEMREELEHFYFELYCRRWSQPEVAFMMARVPMIAMWDDHDIIDGWGSYPQARQSCPVFVAIFEAARRAFAVFQQQVKPDGEGAPGGLSPKCGFSRGHVVGKTAIVALDMRSQRTMDRVLTLDHWAEIYRWLDGLREIDHLLFMSSIPVVYPGFDTIEQILGIIPGQQELEDDLRDHWNSRPHEGERLRLIHRLLRLADEKRIRPTILSGDVHVAALGVIESERRGTRGDEAVVNQLISSGIVHPGPPAAMLFALRYLFDSGDEVDRGITARMIKFPGLSHSFIGSRNFMSLEPDDVGRVWVNWTVEGETDPFVKVLHPLQAQMPA